MGIFGFYGRWLSKNETFKRCILPRLPRDNFRGRTMPLEHIAFDSNSIIHQCAQEVYGYKKGMTDEQKALVHDSLIQRLSIEGGEVHVEQLLFSKITQTIEDVTSSICKDMGHEQLNDVIISIDGVAPLAKITQQRSRRYKSGFQRDHNQLFDSNVITPGTDFMFKLDAHFKSWIATEGTDIKRRVSGQTIYSSHLVRGEGEHKIFDILKGERISNEDGYTVIYGLDADLIMQSLLCKNRNIILYRDDSNGYKSIIDINTLKLDIISELSKTTVKKITTEEHENYLTDFVTMIFLIGNDFLPHVISLHDTKGSIDLLLNTYIQHISGNGFLTNLDASINWDIMSNFLELLSSKEDELMHEIAGIIFDYPCGAIEAATTREISATTQSKEGGVMKVTFDYNKFRDRWYYESLGPRGKDVNNIIAALQIDVYPQEDVEEMSYQYLIGIQWVLKYYMFGTESVTSNYTYWFERSPLLYDLNEMCARVKQQPITLEIVSPQDTDLRFNHYHQLVAVMPPSSSQYIPETFRDLITPGGILNDMCPESFILELEAKTVNNEYEGMVILPPLNVIRVYRAVNSRIKVPKGLPPLSMKQRFGVKSASDKYSEEMYAQTIYYKHITVKKVDYNLNNKQPNKPVNSYKSNKQGGQYKPVLKQQVNSYQGNKQSGQYKPVRTDNHQSGPQRGSYRGGYQQRPAYNPTTSEPKKKITITRTSEYLM